METFEITAMLTALALMFGAVGAKVLAAQLITRMKTQISQVEYVKQGALGRLKGTQSQKAVAEKNKGILAAKKNKLAKRLSRLHKEISQMEEEEQIRRQRAEMRRVD